MEKTTVVQKILHVERMKEDVSLEQKLVDVNLDLSVPKIDVQYHWHSDQELIVVQENAMQLQGIAAVNKTNAKMVRVIVSLITIVKVVLDVEQTIVILRSDYQIMPIVALQHHVMLSMVMDVVVQKSLSVEKVSMGCIFLEFFPTFLPFFKVECAEDIMEL